MAKSQNLEENVNSIIDIAMNRLKEVIDVNTVIGKPINTSNNTTILPVSKVSVGFVAGGGEIIAKAKKPLNMRAISNRQKRTEKKGESFYKKLLVVCLLLFV